MERWVGRVALVTGASSGIGRKVAGTLVKHGMKVIGCSRDISSIQSLAEELSESSGQLFAFRCDLAKEEDILAMFEQIQDEHGGIDVCVNNAGIGFPEPLLTGNAEAWQTMVNVNVLGKAVCTRESVQCMKRRGVDDGHVFYVNSMCGKKALDFKELHFYCACEFAVNAMAQGVRNELRETDSHIRVSMVSPGIVRTDFAYRALGKEVADEVYSDQVLEAQDIADAIVHALSAPPHVQVYDIIVSATENLA